MYHDVFCRDINESGFERERDLPYKMKVDTFEDHVKNISEYCATEGLSKDNIVFTFDDGGKSFYSVVAPILEKYGYKGLFFISTKYIGTDTFLNEAEIISLHKRGHIIGSHAHTHEHLYTLSDKQLEEEWKRSTKILRCIIGEKVRYASIPNGDTSNRVICNAQKYGIEYVYTSEPTTKVCDWNGVNVLGRYVLMGNSSTDYVMSIIKSKKTRAFLICKRTVLKMIKSVLGQYYVKLKNMLIR